MPYGNDVFIDAKGVQAVFQSLILNKDSETEALQHLFIVEKKVRSSVYPKSRHLRLFILQDIVNDIVKSNLLELRQSFGLSLSLEDNPQLLVRQDLQPNSNELLCWSILYWLYVRSDLGIQIEDLAEYISVTPRTIRRQREQALHLVVKQLWQEEFNLRQKVRRKTILNRINFPKNSVYVERNVRIDDLVEYFIENKFGQIYVYGEKGIGKTRFIKECIYKLLDHVELDDVIWMESPYDMEQIIESVIIKYDLEKPSDIVDLCNLIEIAVVLDDADKFLQSTDETIQRLLKCFTGAFIFVSTTLLQGNISNYFQLAPLQRMSDEQSLQLVEKSNVLLSQSDIHRLIYEASGIPQYLEQYMKKYMSSEKNENFHSFLTFHQRSFLVLVPNLKKDAINKHDFDQLRDLCSLSLTEVDQLFLNNYISQSDDTFSANVSHEIMTNIVDISECVEPFVQKLHELNESWKIVIHLLHAFTTQLDVKLRKGLLEIYWRQCVIHCDRIQWQRILSLQTDINSLLLNLIKASVLKHQHNVEPAMFMFNSVIIESGEKGEFSIQAEAIVELVGVYRLLGKFREAFFHLDRLNKSLKQYVLPSTSYRVLIEQVQLLLNVGDVEFGLTLLEQTNGIEISLLKAEAHLQCRNYDKVIIICKELLSDYLSNHHKIVLHNLLGRCYQTSNIELAIQHFNIAIEYATLTMNLTLLGRSILNLAVALIANEDIERSLDRLKHAEKIFQTTNDVVAVETVKRNKSHIQHLLLSRY